MIALTDRGMAMAMLIFAVCCCAIIAAHVLAHNPAKRTHRAFALLCAVLGAWATATWSAVGHSDPLIATWSARMAFASAAFVPAALYWFCGVFPHQRFEGYRGLLGLFLAVGVGVLASSPWPLYIAQLTPGTTLPQITFGPLASAVGALGLASGAFSLLTLGYKLRDTVGQRRRAIEHVILALLSFGAALGVAQIALGPAARGWLLVYAPSFGSLLLCIAAYVLVRYHLQNLRGIAATTLLYTLLSGFVVAIYAVLIAAVEYGISDGGEVRDLLTTAVASVLIAAVLLPIKERLQVLVDRWLLKRSFDYSAFLTRTSGQLARLVKLEDMLTLVGRSFQHTLGAKRVRILLTATEDKDRLVVEFSTLTKEVGTLREGFASLLEHLRAHPSPLILEELLYRRMTPEVRDLATSLSELGAFLCVPLNSASGMVGLVALSEKEAAEPYTLEDVRVVGALAGQIAAAVDNARLYRRLESVNHQLEEIMRTMRGAVLTVSQDGQVLMANRTARDLLGRRLVGEGLAALPAPIADLAARVLEEQRTIPDFETTLPGPDGETLHLALSGTCSRSEDAPPTAVLLIYNLTQLKRLESTVQQADRLASLGTMAAGMAHEIKNPLVSIKTFTQLLHERFDDPDFRATYSEIVPGEVDRIDRIVSGLLDFARPRPVSFEAQPLGLLLGRVLALVSNQTKKQEIQVTFDVPEDEIFVLGDLGQLQQIFLNLFLNAFDAMTQTADRHLYVGLGRTRAHLPPHPERNNFDIPCAQVIVSDTGCGIPPDNARQVFTPFFTTKETGNGLGLAVVYGIVREHGGSIDVSSVEGVGTTFTVLMPLAAAPAAMESTA